MKKEYLAPLSECVPMLAQAELLNSASFDGVGLDDAIEVDWSSAMMVDFDGLVF